MVLINIQNHIGEALVAFTASLFTLLMTAYAWAFEIYDDAVGFAFIQQTRSATTRYAVYSCRVLFILLYSFLPYVFMKDNK
jgi:hypothetical protein